MKSKFISALVAAFVAFGALVAVAQTPVSTVAQTIANTAVVQDQSKLPDQDNRTGYLLAWFDVGVAGGSGSIDVGPYIPDQTLVVGGYAQVVEAILPATATLATNGSITLQSSADLLAAGTSLASTGLKYLKPSAAGTFVTGITLQTANLGTNGAAVVTNAVVATSATAYGGAPVLVTGATTKVTFDAGAVAATSGVVMVYLDLIKVQ